MDQSKQAKPASSYIQCLSPGPPAFAPKLNLGLPERSSPPPPETNALTEQRATATLVCLVISWGLHHIMMCDNVADAATVRSWPIYCSRRPPLLSATRSLHKAQPPASSLASRILMLSCMWAMKALYQCRSTAWSFVPSILRSITALTVASFTCSYTALHRLFLQASHHHL